MKSKIILTIMALLLTVSFIGNAQKKPVQKVKEKPLQQVTSFTGEVLGWANNEDYVFNGFYLQTSITKYLVTFPPHMGSDLTTAIKRGNTVTVNGVEKTNPTGEKEIKLVSVTANGTTINETSPAKPANIAKEEFVNGSGKIGEVQKDKSGKIKGYILDNKTILRVPSNVSGQLFIIAVVDAPVSYSGVKQVLRSGEVAVDSYTIIKCKTITINGKEYLTK